MEQFAIIRQECAVADDVLSWSEDCTFSVVVRSSLGNRNCTTLQLLSACGHRLSALLPVLFLLVSDCAVPLQCLWHESVTLISTCLIIIILCLIIMITIIHLEWLKREKACHNGTCGNRDQNWWINHFCVHRRVHWSRGIGLCLILLIFNAVIGGYLQMRWSLWPTIFTEGLLQKASKQIRPPLIGPRPWRHTPRLIVMHVVFRSLLKIFKYAAKQAAAV